MLAFSTESAKQFGLYAIIGILVFGVVSMFVVRKIVGKIISLVITLGLAATLFGQRNAIDNCVDNLKTTASGAVTGQIVNPTCRFFGIDVEIPADKLNPVG